MFLYMSNALQHYLAIAVSDRGTLRSTFHAQLKVYTQFVRRETLDDCFLFSSIASYVVRRGVHDKRIRGQRTAATGAAAAACEPQIDAGKRRRTTGNHGPTSSQRTRPRVHRDPPAAVRRLASFNKKR